MEVKIKHKRILKIQKHLKFDRMCFVEGINNGGGLALLWNAEESISLLGQTHNFIDVIVNMKDKPPWRLTCFYGFPEVSKRQESWDLLLSLSLVSSLPWCCCGDFNDILSNTEKRGGNVRPMNFITGFQNAVHSSQLSELRLQGYEYTWFKGRGSDNFIEEKLDRVLVSDSWRTLFENGEALNVLSVASDHSAIVIQLSQTSTPKSYSFRFDNCWKAEEGCKAIVKNHWSPLLVTDFQSRTKGCGIDLARWGGIMRTRFKKETNRLRARIGNLSKNRDALSQNKVIQEQKKLKDLLDEEATYWRQRAKQFWISQGDANTKFFHSYASSRKKKNKLIQLRDNQGVFRQWGQGLEEVIRNYFLSLFTAGTGNMDEIIDLISPKISANQNFVLEQPFVEKEVEEAVFAMHPDKSPGPDGFNPGFYHTYWDIVKDSVVELCIGCLNTCSLPDGLNDTDIVLIPKVKNPSLMTELRPISLCNVVVKIMTKMLANRMKSMLNSVVSENQSAFIPGRLISDNVLIAFELGHGLKRRTQGTNGVASLKIDMAKAYDRIEWCYLENMMLKLGFAQSWVKLVMLFVKSVRYSVLHEGSRLGPLIPERGLRQGDPLSAYLFIICAEGLSTIFNYKARQHLITGCRASKNSPYINHLLFADDCCIFFRASTEEALVVKETLQSYEHASGQVINFHKSSVLFSPNTSIHTRDDILGILGVNECSDHGRYLGAPSLIGRERKKVFQYVKEKVISRLNSWKSKFLSRAGKEVLLKAVIHAIPSYIMSVFLLPTSLCDDIERTMNAFWWGDANRKGIRWKSWNNLCIHKSQGGLGFRKIHNYNLALLAKQAWRLLTCPNTLFFRVFAGKYFYSGSFLDAKLGENPSYVWRGIWSTQALIRGAARVRIGTGIDTPIFNCPWLQAPDPFISSEANPLISNCTVDGLLLPSSSEWDSELILSLFNARDQTEIRRVQRSWTGVKDTWYWSPEESGLFSVKSAYRESLFLSKTATITVPVSDFKRIWKLDIPFKIRNFLWRILVQVLPTRVALANKHVEVDTRCPLCGAFDENELHVFVECTETQQVWAQTDFYVHSGSAPSFLAWWNDFSSPLSMNSISLFAVILWCIWLRRNTLVWQGKLPSALSITHQAKEIMRSWRASHVRSRKYSPRVVSNAVWSPPLRDSFKLNVDAGWHSSYSVSGVGGIIRDHNGSFVAAFCRGLEGVCNAKVAEALGIREALR